MKIYLEAASITIGSVEVINMIATLLISFIYSKHFLYNN